ncbi:cryptochrome/photolyase family protein [Roseomonas nepalensis]|uniref:Cryptochrome/photolyase family protein n=1 Tax=Muricoccus nepalensis TaxID=1854500 RepID=A0A502G814_9PROT|nr:cryptochrome/photolyase family protein [Roseomonas nepalensis]TPG57530.1 cryptochrome/photolyase family protein [Roseomonas nepalensis]
MAGALRLVLGDQLSESLASLRDLDPSADTVLLAEVMAECTYVRHHKQKIVLVLSAMRHFAGALAALGLRVRHVRLDDPANTGSLEGEVLRAARDLRPSRIVVTHPGEWRLLEAMQGWEEAAGVPVDILEDDRFLCSLPEFRRWAGEKRNLRMEFFYRAMRRTHGVLMEADGTPLGGAWNFDRENRAPLRRLPPVPPRPAVAPDAVTREVMDLVERFFPDHFGTLEGFGWPVTRAEAVRALEDFVARRFPGFGLHQDQMASGEPFLFHALVSTSLNLGLLLPWEVVAAAEAAYRAGHIPLAAAEGFVRQVLGWREYVRGVYWSRMPAYRSLNALAAERPLPGFYWTGETRMNCVRQVVRQTRDHAYAHHIQRLMVTGNLALLAGLAPEAVNEWYLIVFADAYEWVELPNVQGMALHADGGIMGSKPYAASGAYINRMSDYCRGCAYDVRDAAGEGACPFNSLYWDFLARHRDRFAANPRLRPSIHALERMPPERLSAIRARAARWLEALEEA